MTRLLALFSPLLLVIPVVVGSLESPARSATPTTVSTGCLRAVTAPVKAFYRWYFAQGMTYRSRFASQHQHFTPAFFQDLVFGFMLQPSEAGFVDFDPFSAAQVSSYNAHVEGCRSAASGRQIVRVSVLRGLRRQGATSVSLDYVLVRQGSGWLIEDIRYPESGDFSLQDLLINLRRRHARLNRSERLKGSQSLTLSGTPARIT